MRSKQDIEVELSVIQDKLDFIMDTFRMKAVVSSGLTGPDGKPVGKTMDASLRQLYYMSRSLPTLHQTDVEVGETENGN